MHLFDGAMGTMLQKYGLAGSECPDYCNVSHPDIVQRILGIRRSRQRVHHHQYLRRFASKACRLRAGRSGGSHRTSGSTQCPGSLPAYPRRRRYRPHRAVHPSAGRSFLRRGGQQFLPSGQGPRRCRRRLSHHRNDHRHSGNAGSPHRRQGGLLTAGHLPDVLQ